MAVHPWRILTATLLVAVATQRSFVDTAPLAATKELAGTPRTQSEDDSVQELQNLKHSLGKTFEVMKTHSLAFSSESNGRKGMHADIKEQVSADGKKVAAISQQVDSEMPAKGDEASPLSKVRTEMEIPIEGIHRTIVQENGHEPVITDNGNRRNTAVRNVNSATATELANDVNKYNSDGIQGVQYSPLDMAEYVFWTGDERGVTQAIEEFLQEGLMSREEAVTFLQDIKINLDYLQTHYPQQGVYSQDHTKNNVNTFLNYGGQPQQYNNENINRKQYDLSDLRQDMSKKNSMNIDQEFFNKFDETEDYEELLQKLRVADFLYTEYSLEEIIYQLSKIMFTQSLTRGSTEAQTALQKFTNFLETEAENGHISRALEKKVLDVLIAALTDTLSEHPALVPVAREGLGGDTSNLGNGNPVLQKVFETTHPYKVQSNGVSSHNKGQITDISNPKLSSLVFGKYKN